MFALGELLHGRVPLGLGALARGLRLVMALLGGEEFLLGGIERGARGGLGGGGLLGAGGGRGDGESRDGDLLLELEGAGTLGVAARAGGGELAADIGEAVLEIVEASGERLGLLLGGDALALGIGNASGGGSK